MTPLRCDSSQWKGGSGLGRQDLVEPQLEQLAEIDLLLVFDVCPILGGRGEGESNQRIASARLMGGF
jgi:hypothetical protein